MNFYLSIVCLLISGQAFAASTPVLSPTFTQIKAVVLTAKCLQCHVPGQSAEDVPFETYDQILNHPDGLVVPGHPEESLLVSLIEQSKMPPSRSGIPPVTPDELAAIKRWITQGAQND